MAHRHYNEPYTPPRWTIDLSLPPTDRYRRLARAYKDAIRGLTGLFDSLLRDIAVPEKWIPTMNRLSRLLLRRVNDSSQTEELRGIAEESGGVRSLEKGQPFSEAKMLHFRTLDWSMDPLRQILVQLDFVRSKSDSPEQVLASSITYVGFTGVLTGVRPGLSMSLNFRGLHDNSSKAAQFRFYFHHLLVLLGRRPSIASYLRGYLTGDHEDVERSLGSTWKSARKPRATKRSLQPAQLADVHKKISSYHTTAAYLIFSDGDSTMSIDKDFRTAKMRHAADFIATTNHDVVEHKEDQQENIVAARAVQSAARHAAGFDEFLDESEDRLKCISNRWQRLVVKKQKEAARLGRSISMKATAAQTWLNQKQVIDWVSKYPTTNECTHFAAVMDPKDGNVVWCRAYPEPRTSEDQLQLEG
ncbi:hypothetical protein LTR70_003104 [Exophiala xenobiotica]|uniref:ceramidase n=1 Tax=Lithohypha guttulata TaxID=1690604 RepID=A0ABR0KH82_9EURO|nr:hypothetical protein LTR24_002663 [Lithohypha guttulata]KAK5323815.1 hypothetical protein LTR70_003104 [Exophiala xenobiotica]